MVFLTVFCGNRTNDVLIYRGEMLELDHLQSDIMREVDTFQSLITRRMTSATTFTSSDLDSTSDLGTLGVIHEVSVWMVLWDLVVMHTRARVHVY